jgi:hypothetical protein
MYLISHLTDDRWKELKTYRYRPFDYDFKGGGCLRRASLGCFILLIVFLCILILVIPVALEGVFMLIPDMTATPTVPIG